MTTKTALMLPWSYGQQPIVFFWIYGQEANCKLFCLKSQNTRKRTGTINPPAADSFYTFYTPPRYSHLKRSRMKEKWFGEFLPNGPKSAPGGQKNGPNFTGWLEITTSAAPSHLSSPWMVGLCAKRGAGHLNSPPFQMITSDFLSLPVLPECFRLSSVCLNSQTTRIISCKSHNNPSHGKSFPLSLFKHL